MYSPNLPIEEQRRLDQWWSNQAQWGQDAEVQAHPKRTLSTAINPYREGGLASVNPFAAAPTKDIYDSWTSEQQSEWDRYEEFGKPGKPGLLEPPIYHPSRKADHGPGSFGPEVRPKIPEGEVGQRFNDDTYRPSFPGLDWLRPGIVEPQPEYQLPQPEVMPNPFGPNIDDTYPTADEVRPQPGPQPIDTPFPISRPITSPRPAPQPIDTPFPISRPITSPRPAPIPTIPGGGMPRPEVTPRPGPQPFLGTLLPTGQQQSGLTYSDDEKIRPPSIQVSRKHGGSLTQTVLNVLRNLS